MCGRVCEVLGVDAHSLTIVHSEQKSLDMKRSIVGKRKFVLNVTILISIFTCRSTSKKMQDCYNNTVSVGCHFCYYFYKAVQIIF